tara:strand:+ start:81 stop:551 length:471 start_codon:yes stop_codon:yes gene_type:complete
MINTLDAYLTFNNIYLFANWGVIPFWLLLISMPNHGITKFFSHSIIPYLLLGFSYIFLGYKIFLDGSIFASFNLYLGHENLYEVYSDESFLIVFWLHFLSISLFVGSWIARDGQRHMIPGILTAICLIATYFAGPLGIVIYWFIRIFYSKKINFNE